MEKITNQTHTKENFLYATSRTLERASYYGLRSLIVLYMIGGILKMGDAEALSIYGWFTASLVFSQIIGAMLGDLLIGNKKAIILGAFVQLLGAFSFCIPTTTGLYIGLFFVILGGGLYSPNLISNYGKLYLDKTKLLDAGFTIFYLVANIGAFFGVVTIGYIGEKYGWNVGFITAGIIMLFSIIPILFSKNEAIKSTIENKTIRSKRNINISIAFALVGLFWAIYELGNYRVYGLHLQLGEISTMGIPKSMWTSISSILMLPIGLLSIILWTYFYSSQFFKLMIGFIFGAISFGILLFIPEVPTEQHIILYLISLLFLSVSEIHIAPIIHSILTQYSNPKYLAILISLDFIPTRMFSFIIILFNEDIYEKPTVALLIGMIAMTILSIGLIYYHTNKKLSTIV